MHILKIIHGYPPDYNAGSEVYSQSIVNELSKSNKITVFTREENDYLVDFNFRKEKQGAIDFVFVNMARSKDAYNHSQVNSQFAELIAEIKPDIAHIGHLNHLSTGIVEELHKAKIPIVFTLHDFWLMCPRGQFLQRNFDGENLYNVCEKQEDNKCANSCYKMYFSNSLGEEYYTEWVANRMNEARLLVDKIDLFIAPSKYLMNRFVNEFGLPQNKIIYLDYGFPTHYLQPVIPKTNGIFTFGYIGTHIPAKGLNILINAFQKIKKPAKLKIFGRLNGQNTRALRKMAKKSVNKVVFCGEYINQNLATSVFSHVNAIVVPSIWGENSPLVIHEAQACKIPVITADFGGMKEYIHHNVNGLLFKHRDVESLHTQMEFAIENTEQMKTLGNRAYLYSNDGQVPNISKHCNELIELFKLQINEK